MKHVAVIGAGAMGLAASYHLARAGHRVTVFEADSMVEMRACDHQAVYPMYFGTTKKLPQYDFVVASDILTLSGNEVMPSCDDILKARKK